MSVPPLISTLAFIMWGIFLVMGFFPPPVITEFYTTFGLRLFMPYDSKFLWLISWVTSLFLHGNLAHIFFNTFALVTLGSLVFRWLGRNHFLIFFLVTGLAGSAAHAILNWGTPALVLGASATLFAMLACFPYMSRGFEQKSTKEKAILVLRYALLIMFLNIGFAYVAGGTAEVGKADISWEAHAGGYLAGMILFPFLKLDKPLYELPRMRRRRKGTDLQNEKNAGNQEGASEEKPKEDSHSADKRKENGTNPRIENQD